MAQFTVRNLEASIHTRLKELARRHGRSMEEEVRAILRAAVAAEANNAHETGLGTRISRLFADQPPGDDISIPEFRGYEVRPAQFDE